jgi:hypothetical protein
MLTGHPALAKLGLPAVLVATLWCTGCATHPKGEHGPACTRIEAASTLTFNDRQHALARIAATPNLSQHEQIYLVSVAIVTGGMADDVAGTLVALVKNPSCSEETREYVGKQLPWVGMSDARRRVVDALIETQPRATASGA